MKTKLVRIPASIPLSLIQEAINEVRGYDVSAQLDSNGRAVRMSKVNLGSSSSSTAEVLPVVGELWRYPSMSRTVRVTEVSKKEVKFDVVSKSGEVTHKDMYETLKSFLKNYDKILSDAEKLVKILRIDGEAKDILLKSYTAWSLNELVDWLSLHGFNGEKIHDVISELQITDKAGVVMRLERPDFVSRMKTES